MIEVLYYYLDISLPIILSNNNVVCHTICALCSPSSTLNDISTLNGYICPDMTLSSYTCCFCNSNKGVILRCSHPGIFKKYLECEIYCHPSCGIENSQNVGYSYDNGPLLYYILIIVYVQYIL